ncbi:MAG: hypothetical protein ACK4K1_00040 [Flavobacterium sp.]
MNGNFTQNTTINGNLTIAGDAENISITISNNATLTINGNIVFNRRLGSRTINISGNGSLICQDFVIGNTNPNVSNNTTHNLIVNTSISQITVNQNVVINSSRQGQRRFNSTLNINSGNFIVGNQIDVNNADVDNVSQLNLGNGNPNLILNGANPWSLPSQGSFNSSLNTQNSTVIAIGENQLVKNSEYFNLEINNNGNNGVRGNNGVKVLNKLILRNGTLKDANKIRLANNATIERRRGNMENFPLLDGNYDVEYTDIDNNLEVGAEIPSNTTNLRNVKLNANGKRLVANKNLPVKGNLEIVAGTLDLGNFSADRSANGGTLSISNQGVLRIGGNKTLPANYTNHILEADSEVVYEGAQTQIIAAINNGNAYGKLTLRGSENKILGGNHIRVIRDVRVEENARLLVDANQTLEITQALVNNTGNANNAFFANNSNLLQTGANNNNVGSIRYQRATRPLKNLDFVYWGSMVDNQTLGTMWMTTVGETFYRFNTSVNNWAGVPASQIMQPGVGYIARARHNSNGWAVAVNGTPTAFTTHLNGRPRSGNITAPLTANGWNLLANPYPSAIDFDAFALQGFASYAQSPILPTVYYWTQATPITNNSYSANDYAVYSAPNEVGVSVGGFTPGRHIAAGQGFFVRAKANVGAEIQFTNQQRVGANNANFTKPGGGKDSDAGQNFTRERYWLNLTNQVGDFKQIAIVHSNYATNNYDELYDALAFNGNTNMNFFSLVENRRISIQGRSAFEVSDEIILGYTANTAGNYTISIAQIDAVFDNRNVFLEDLLLGTVHDLKAGSYTFNSATGTHLNRFKVKYYDEVLGNPSVELSSLVAFIQNQILHVKTAGDVLEKIELFDVQGRTLQVFDNLQTNQVEKVLHLNNQLIIAKFTSVDGKTTTKKLL